MLIAAGRCEKHSFWANFRIKFLTILSINPNFLNEKLKIKMSDQLLKSFKNIKEMHY